MISSPRCQLNCFQSTVKLKANLFVTNVAAIAACPRSALATLQLTDSVATCTFYFSLRNKN